MDRWVGRVAIVTGASSGIGAAIARVLTENGMKVVGVARRLDKLQALAGELSGCKGEFHAVQGDITKEEEVIRVVKWARDTLGGADVLVNNAGTATVKTLPEIDTEGMRKTLDLNILGLCMCTREVVKDMRDRGVDDGHIFHISSICGHLIFAAYFYSGTKHAVRVMTEGLRRELRDLKTKIRVTEISPGLVRTEFAEAAGKYSAEEAEKYYNSAPCLESVDVANALLYALTTPPHVQVHEITILPTGQTT